MGQEGAGVVGVRSGWRQSGQEDKATSTDDELLISPAPAVNPDVCFRYMAQAAQMWGADLVGGEKSHGGREGRYLRHQESLSSNSDVSRPQRNVKLKRQRTSESCDVELQRRPKTRELRRQWTTDSSDSGYGYSKRCSREPLRRQDTEESADSTKRLIRNLQRQATNESSSSLRLTRQSSIRSTSDNQSLYLMRQSTVETYDDVSTTDFSRPQSCNSGRNPSVGGAVPDFQHSFPPTKTGRHLSEADKPVLPQDIYGYDYTLAIPAAIGAPLLSTTSCSLINLSAVDLEAAEIRELHRNLRAINTNTNTNTNTTNTTTTTTVQPRPKRKHRSVEGSNENEALRKARERVRRRKEEDEMPRKVRWSIMATGLILLLMSVILVGATLKMAPLIDEMGESRH
ncbi:hypothetical protein Pmani_026808 [Petrolisthes manimaculis]|uniref:Uncharacterized protein n=1 Tax=Petrolisthes manimaculis TaxID=1843537 RepID=A0AAE1P504_9EUCA|nr:hypothetical protein Pmani_026808 [Petrolisthes manimaculis]